MVLTKVDLPKPDWPVLQISMNFSATLASNVPTHYHDIKVKSSFQQLLFDLLRDSIKTNIAFQGSLK